MTMGPGGPCPPPPPSTATPQPPAGEDLPPRQPAEAFPPRPLQQGDHHVAAAQEQPAGAQAEPEEVEQPAGLPGESRDAEQRQQDERARPRPQRRAVEGEPDHARPPQPGDPPPPGGEADRQ